MFIRDVQEFKSLLNVLYRPITKLSLFYFAIYTLRYGSLGSCRNDHSPVVFCLSCCTYELVQGRYCPPRQVLICER